MLIKELDNYFDEVLRNDSDPVEVGAFTLFVSGAPYGYYARPSFSHSGPIAVADLVALTEACKEREIDLAIEWMHEAHPGLGALAQAHGLKVNFFPMLITGAKDVVTPNIEDATIRILTSDEPALAQGLAVANLSFGVGGTDIGLVGSAERDKAVSELTEGWMGYFRERIRSGLTVMAVAESADGVLAVASCKPVGKFAEIVGVATLPSARRRGLGAAVTAFLASHVFAQGVETVLLSAEDDNVARIYRQIGFHRVGTAGAVEKEKS
ncbi:MAG: GNAT family N-acetyltransferase [Candidatus Nanopelagicaceae bacterium]|nr:GNAT family N-acetyltransferase [Candidatus Nanopelagicaceae bacterium]